AVGRRGDVDGGDAAEPEAREGEVDRAVVGAARGVDRERRLVVLVVRAGADDLEPGRDGQPAVGRGPDVDRGVAVAHLDRVRRVVGDAVGAEGDGGGERVAEVVRVGEEVLDPG